MASIKLVEQLDTANGGIVDIGSTTPFLSGREATAYISFAGVGTTSTVSIQSSDTNTTASMADVSGASGLSPSGSESGNAATTGLVIRTVQLKRYMRVQRSVSTTTGDINVYLVTTGA